MVQILLGIPFRFEVPPTFTWKQSPWRESGYTTLGLYLIEDLSIHLSYLEISTFIFCAD